MVLAIIFKLYFGYIGFLRLKDVYEELAVLKTEMLRILGDTDLFRMRQWSFEIFFSFGGSCGMLMFSVSKLFKWYGSKFDFVILG